MKEFINMKIGFALTVSFLLGLNLIAQEKATGYVFEDSNQNGKKDGREKGIAKVALTNGRDVVLTDAKGKYELLVGEDDIISVIKPAGYKVGREDRKSVV